MVGHQKTGKRDGGELHRLCRNEEHARRAQRFEGAALSHQSLAQVSWTVAIDPARQVAECFAAARAMVVADGGRAITVGITTHAASRAVHSDRLVHRLPLEQHLCAPMGHDRFQIARDEAQTCRQSRKPQAHAARQDRRSTSRSSATMARAGSERTCNAERRSTVGRRAGSIGLPVRCSLAAQTDFEAAKILAGSRRESEARTRRYTARFATFARHAFDDGGHLDLGSREVAGDDCGNGGKGLRTPSPGLAKGCVSGTLGYRRITEAGNERETMLSKSLILLVGATGFEPATPSPPDITATSLSLNLLRYSKRKTVNASRTSGRWITDGLPSEFPARSTPLYTPPPGQFWRAG